MGAPSATFETRPFLRIRHAYGDLLAAARTKDIIHGLVEIDVTDVRHEIDGPTCSSFSAGPSPSALSACSDLRVAGESPCLRPP
ncbi:hypothetical protein MLP_13100 [Microlunatus phosphovorus NM-1]|uniref:Uncharacterized protein n=1 Tax=Microlunatus phosphovorus (strain ATCC 700054 / DSM 10555 / JCM 9379 / NBRC 101784 / NCIMB 13414 / VKM Ac-1990 / NM-1) TaxID=1032480 RepID=F5XPL6_MICPN|nr:hypothetical protein [Microlunatus phosphovorus]BAK34324.1 hypothetical protein MLP_13100 [Microlunatus phosphovorus NM-1]